MSRLDEIEQRAKAAESVYQGEHVVAWRHGVCVGDSEDVPWLVARVRALEAGLAGYGEHKPRCYAAPLGLVGGPPCVCGLAALAANDG